MSGFARGLVWAGTRHAALPTGSRALSGAEKTLAFASRRSLRSMPGPRGLAPTRIAKLVSLMASLASEVAVTLFKVANAQSLSSMTTPCTAALAAWISRRFKFMG